MHINLTSFRRTISTGSILLCSLSLLFVLGACSSASTSSTPATESPTPVIHLATYQAKTFSIGYPTGWQATNNNDYVLAIPGAEMVALDEELTNVTVEAVPDTGNKSAEVFVSSISRSLGTSVLTGVKPANLPPTIQVGKETWVQQGYTGDGGSNGVKLPEKVVCLANQHTQNKYLYGICLTTPTSGVGVDRAIDSKFQAMLNSFQFK